MGILNLLSQFRHFFNHGVDPDRKSCREASCTSCRSCCRCSSSKSGCKEGRQEIGSHFRAFCATTSKHWPSNATRVQSTPPINERPQSSWNQLLWRTSSRSKLEGKHGNGR